MNEKTRTTILAYRKALNYVKTVPANTTEEMLAKEYATHYYLEKMRYFYVAYYESEEYMEEEIKDSKEGESAFLELTEEEVKEEVKERIKEEKEHLKETNIILNYLRGIVNMEKTEKYMEKYGWI